MAKPTFNPLIDTTKIFIGPMSKLIVDSVIEYCEEKNVNIALIPSRRQVECKKFGKGYVHGWETKEFINYVKSKTDKVLLVRDHAGPNQHILPDHGYISMKQDINLFDVIHIDPWKKYPDYFSGMENTMHYVNFCYSLNNNIIFEIGTEQSIREFSHNELNKLLTDLSDRLKPEIFDRIRYLVIQCGTSLKDGINTGEYDKSRLLKMLKIAKKWGLQSKEHNGDFQDESLIKEKFKLGLNTINIAPEFGRIQTQAILDKIKDNQEKIDYWFNLCLESKKWEKWVSEDFKPEENKIELILITGHYLFSNADFIKFLKKIGDLDDEIKIKIKEKLEKLISCYSE